MHCHTNETGTGKLHCERARFIPHIALPGLTSWIFRCGNAFLSTQRRTQVEHQMAEIALKTRSAVRQEIRSKRRESKLLSTLAKASGVSYFATDSVGEKERITQNVGNPGSAARKPEGIWKAPTARRNLHKTEVCLESGFSKKLESKPKCGTSTFWDAADVDADVLLNTLLLISTFAAGYVVMLEQHS